MNLEMKNINALRILAVDMIEQAKSGHPGISLGIAPALYTLYSKHMNVDPSDDKNIFRDRFVLSAGHGSSIYYATLYAMGYKLTIEDLKNFRQLDSITPGHPEYGVTPGVDASTGPLGQGVSMAVGLAIAQKKMASAFNKPDITLFDNYTYTLIGEGCLMEGVSFESLSLAGTLKLNKLIVLYDCNNVTLDSSTKGVMDLDVISYMKSLNFNCIEVKDGNNVEEINNAIISAKQSMDKPSFIKINTHIGFGSVHQDSNKAHGSILGKENVDSLRKVLNVNFEPFVLDKDITRDFVFVRKRFDSFKKSAKDRVKVYSKAYPGDYRLLKTYLNNEISIDSLENMAVSESMSGRDMSGILLNKLGESNPNILMGSADVFSSTKVYNKSSGFVNDNFSNNNVKYGVREFAMGAIANGISLYGGILPIISTFLVFSDYMKSALRLGSLMNLNTISVFTHDSIAVGEDGPTHQSCEQIWTLRSIPNMKVFRPSNISELKAAYVTSLKQGGMNSIVLSRQKMDYIQSSTMDAVLGGYIIAREAKGDLNGVIIATGSEVGLALEIKRLLGTKGYNIRVVSMPCIEVFDKQSEKYKNSVIPNNLKSIFSIEAGSTIGWYKYVGKYGKCFGVDTFGMSAPCDDIYKRMNLSSEYISKEIIKIIKNNKEKNFSLN